MSSGRGGPHHDRLVLQDLVVAGSHPLNLTVLAGEVVAVSGWSASELFWAVAGLHRATSGQIAVDSQTIVVRQDALAAGVALIPQSGALASLLTAFENVATPLADRRSSSSRGAIGARHAEPSPATLARDALAALGLAESADHLVEELSGGQQQRVAVARAVAARPRVLLADQVTTDLDPGNRVRVVAVLRELAARGTAVLLASDDPAVRDSCDRTVELD